jgi:hypothetical protein
MPETAAGLQQAVARVHESLNKTAGTSLFGNNIDNFIQNKPNFSPVKPDIEKFFALSRKVFFEPESAQNSSEHTKAWLMKFCRHLRDCERGLRPEASA